MTAEGKRFERLFGVVKPVIAMAHFPPLPGAPLYNREQGVAGMVEVMRGALLAIDPKKKQVNYQLTMG